MFILEGLTPGSSQNNLHNRGLNEMHEIFSAHFVEQHLSNIQIFIIGVGLQSYSLMTLEGKSLLK